ncbi:MAG: DEAD/DEAH box helicase [Armatimonadetes bacterium]|nr:DEAD/DEAH box helicase [Armatimonadota bacterium]
MRFASLEAFGIHEDFISAWEQALGPKMLPIQEKAVRAGLLNGQSVVCVAPAGAGKTVVAEMAIACALKNRSRAWYLVPTRALAEQKHGDLLRRFAAAGLRGYITTRDHSTADQLLLQGEFDLAVAVPEKMRALARAAPSLIGQAALVVVDELQLLGDAERGPVLEMLIADLLTFGRAEIVALTACASNAAALADWLRARLVEDHFRPVELRLGVLTEGVFTYREQNSGQWGEEAVEYQPLDDSLAGHFAGLALAFASRGEQTLVFVRDRASANALAARLSESQVLRPAEGLLSRLAEGEPTASTDFLRAIASGGIGLHHSDLQAPERMAVEEALATGELQLVVCTSTLAAGLNLPARNVIIDAVQWQTSTGPARHPAQVPLPVADFLAMAGRAGRPGHGDRFGRAILLAATPVQREALLDAYVRAGPPVIEPALLCLQSEDALVALGVSGCAAEHGLEAAWRATFSARFAPAGEPPWRKAIARLANAGFLDAEQRPTALLRAAMGSSADAATLVWLKRFADAGPQGGDWFDLLAVACSAPYMARLPFPFSRAELRHADYVAELLRWGGELGLGGPIMAAVFHSPALAAHGRQRAAKLALALLHWASSRSRADVEAAVRLPLGRLEGLASSVAWLMEVAVSMAIAAGWSEYAAQGLRDAARAIRFGLPPAEGVVEQPAPAGLTHVFQPWGGRAARELGAGREGPAAPPLPKEQSVARVSSAVPGAADGPSGHIVPVIGLDDASPDRATVLGVEVRLTTTQFRLLWRLAKEPCTCVRYRPLISFLFGAEEYEGPHQVYPHLSRLRAKLREVAGEQTDDWLVTLRGVGVKLNLRPDQVQLKTSQPDVAA